MTKDGDEEKKLTPLSEADLANAAIAGRESGNQIGLKLRDWQSKVTQSVLELYAQHRPEDREPVIGRLRSCAIRLLDLPRFLLDAVPVLSDREQDMQTHRLSLIDAFEVQPEELERQLPWCGPEVELVLTYAEGQPVYSIYASEPDQIHEDQTEADSTLEISLQAQDGRRCTAVLSAHQMASVLEGDPMPAEPDSVTMNLALRSK